MCSSKEEGKEEKWLSKKMKKEMDNKRIFMTSHMTLSAVLTNITSRLHFELKLFYFIT